MGTGELAALADAVFWAGAGVTTKRLSAAVRPIHVSALLATVATCALIVIALATGHADNVVQAPALSVALFAAGAVAGAAGMLLFFVAISSGSVGATFTTTSGLYILFSMVAGVVFLGDDAGPSTYAGAVAIVAGIWLLNTRAAPAKQAIPIAPAVGERRAGRRVHFSRAVITSLSAGSLVAALWAVDLILSAKGLEEADLLTNGLVHQVVPAVLFGSFLLLNRRARRAQFQARDLRMLAVAGTLYVCSTLSWNYALANTDAGITALLASTSPVFALVFAGVILRERLPRASLAGAALAFAGIVAVVGTR